MRGLPPQRRNIHLRISLFHLSGFNLDTSRLGDIHLGTNKGARVLNAGIVKGKGIHNVILGGDIIRVAAIKHDGKNLDRFLAVIFCGRPGIVPDLDSVFLAVSGIIPVAGVALLAFRPVVEHRTFAERDAVDDDVFAAAEGAGFEVFFLHFAICSNMASFELCLNFSKNSDFFFLRQFGMVPECCIFLLL